MQKKRIYILIPSLQAGGMERVASILLNNFYRHYSVELHLVLFGMKRDVFYHIPADIQIHRPSFGFDDKKRKLYTIKTMLFLRKTLKGSNSDAILSFGEYWNNLVLLSALGLNLPIFVTDRCQPNKSLGKFQNTLRNWLYPKAKGVIVQTQMAKSIYSKRFNHKNLVVIGNPILNIASVKEIQKENIVLTVGRLINTKHHDLLIKSFVKVRKPGWRLVIVGEDALKQKNKLKLQALIQDLNADDFVELTGERPDVAYFYERSKIFAFPSSSEGFPNVIGEALSSGLPVVAFDCIAGPSELIKDGFNGYLVPLFDTNLFEEKLSNLMADNDLRNRMAANAPQSIILFNSDNICNSFYEFLTK